VTAELDFAASIEARLGRIEGSLAAEQAWRRKCAGAIQMVPLVSRQSTVAAEAIDQPDALMCKTGYIWDIKRLTLSGWSAGSVQVTKNSALGEVLVSFPVPATATFGKLQQILMPGERLVIVTTGITGTVQLQGSAVCFESWYFPYYAG
jgi:hypothetical protein